MEFRAGEGAGIAACVGWATNETQNETETAKKAQRRGTSRASSLE